MTRPPLTDLLRVHAEVIQLRAELAAKTRELLVMLRHLIATDSYSGRDLSRTLGYSPTWVARLLANSKPTPTPVTPVYPPVSIRDEEPEF